MQDPRFKNENPDGKSVTEYLGAYSARLHAALAAVDQNQLEQAYALLEAALSRGTHIYAGGNGGSAAIADHLCCDWMKGTHVTGKPALKVHSVTSNSAVLTALANDFGYEHSLAKQIEYLGEKGDVAVLISSSGNSPNVLKAAEVARAKGMKIIGMSGFSGGKLKELSDVSLYVAVNNYGICEDAHQILMHALAQYLAKRRDLSR